MALITLKLDPSPKDLQWFGVIILVFFLLLAGMLYWVAGARTAPGVLVGVGAGLAAIYYAVPPIRSSLFRLWMRAVYPIGWVVSHALFGAIYYLVFTPIGFVLRQVRRDPIRSQARRDSYWSKHEPEADSSRYFRQF